MALSLFSLGKKLHFAYFDVYGSGFLMRKCSTLKGGRLFFRGLEGTEDKVAPAKKISINRWTSIMGNHWVPIEFQKSCHFESLYYVYSQSTLIINLIMLKQTSTLKLNFFMQN